MHFINNGMQLLSKNNVSTSGRQMREMSTGGVRHPNGVSDTLFWDNPLRIVDAQMDIVALHRS